MSESSLGETTDDLLTAAKNAGILLSKRQITELHRKGYLPQPERRFLGRGRGCVSVYPPGTTERLLLVCRYKQRSPHDMSQVAWALWWDGQSVPMDQVRLQLTQVAGAWAKNVQEIKAHFWDEGEFPDGEQPWLSERMLDQLDMTVTKRLPRKTLTQARKRLGRDRFDTFVRVMLEIAIGEFRGFAEDYADDEPAAAKEVLVEKGLGLQRARKDRALGVGPWLQDSIEPSLVTLSQNLRDMPPGHDLASVTDGQLAHARDEVRSFLQLMGGFSRLAEYYLGKYAFGFSGLAQAIDDAKAPDQAMMLLFWLAMRQWGLGEKMNIFIGLAQQWESMWSLAAGTLQQIAVEVPETAAILAKEQVRGAFKSQNAWDDHLNKLREVREQYLDQFTAFFARHPEIQWQDADQLPPPATRDQSEHEQPLHPAPDE